MSASQLLGAAILAIMALAAWFIFWRSTRIPPSGHDHQQGEFTDPRSTDHLP